MLPPLSRRDFGWLIIAFRRAMLKGVFGGVAAVIAVESEGGGRHCFRSSSGAQR